VIAKARPVEDQGQPELIVARDAAGRVVAHMGLGELVFSPWCKLAGCLLLDEIGLPGLNLVIAGPECCQAANLPASSPAQT
jgi:hypothetical protein